jgi:hypothetical protein
MGMAIAKQQHAVEANQYKRYQSMRSGMVKGMALLVLQFMVGMYLNFFVELPAQHPGTDGSYAPSIPWALSGGGGIALVLHVVLWIVLTTGALALLIRAVRSKTRRYIIGCSAGLFWIVLAGSGGLNFLNRGGSDGDSMGMAIGFILALVTYAVLFYQTRND